MTDKLSTASPEPFDLDRELREMFLWPMNAVKYGHAEHRIRSHVTALEAERDALRRMLEKSTVRLGILRDRMESCQERSGNMDRHALSLFEIPAWIDEQTRPSPDAPASPPETAAVTGRDAISDTITGDPACASTAPTPTSSAPSNASSSSC
jgi:hypothetical protein